MRIKKCETVFSLISQVLISSVLLRTDAFNKIISNKDFDSNNTLYYFFFVFRSLRKLFVSELFHHHFCHKDRDIY